MFKKVLVANRGEIAVRVIEACRELGIKTVAVFSEPDRQALHVKLADEAFCIGPAEARASYLNIPAIMSAAEVSKADAIHPGYGFLAEDPNFVEVCEESKIKFIGPSFEAVRKAGNKLEAKLAVAAAGVPVVPGSGAIKTEEEALQEAHKLGLPLIMKAAAGGGGRGMRIVHNDTELVKLFHAARREAESAFGDPTVFFEKYLPHARHIEVQILADSFKHIVHWGERECSIQRRYQKLIEESPAPKLNQEMRTALWQAAVTAAKALNYQNAGTVEFLMNEDGFYLIEINARIQVEHPISEERVGRNLIKEQIRLAAGEKLGYSQKDIKLQGHAIECRINAEDPEQDFLPQAGKVKIKQLPGGHGVRIDTALYDDLEMTPHYDSLLAKVITHGRSREEALMRMSQALRRFELDGIKTTKELCEKIIESEAFITGEFDTGFLKALLESERRASA